MNSEYSKEKMYAIFPFTYLLLFAKMDMLMPAWWNGRHSRLKIYRERSCIGSSPIAGIFLNLYILSWHGSNLTELKLF